MLTKPEIFKKAQEIIKNREEEQQHLNICLQANICPECGSALILTDSEEYYNLEIKKCISCKFTYEIVTDYWDEMDDDGGF